MARGAHLQIEALVSGYGPTRVVDAISLELPPGAALAVLGRNGVGKSTLVNSIAGRATIHSGRILLDGAEIAQAPPFARCRLGLGLVPQDRQVFKTLTVEENLAVADLKRGWNADDTYALFPRLAERRRNAGANLSGGEQQMLSIGRALMGNPRCLLLDEPFEGLAPVIIEGLIESLRRLRAQVGLTTIIVEQHAKVALELSDTGIILERGAVVLAGRSDELLSNWSRIEALLSVA